MRQCLINVFPLFPPHPHPHPQPHLNGHRLVMNRFWSYRVASWWSSLSLLSCSSASSTWCENAATRRVSTNVVNCCRRPTSVHVHACPYLSTGTQSADKSEPTFPNFLSFRLSQFVTNDLSLALFPLFPYGQWSSSLSLFSLCCLIQFITTWANEFMNRMKNFIIL